jgi:hypothetical protein
MGQALLGTLIGLLSKARVIKEDDFGTIIKEFVTIAKVTEINPNPLTLQETATLNGYIRRAQQGTMTSPMGRIYPKPTA